jgi:hypothetical protein
VPAGPAPTQVALTLRIAGALDVTTDATQRVLSAQALQTTFQTFEQRVEERTRELSTLLEVSRSLIPPWNCSTS